MNENAITMKKEIRAVANYKAILISKNYITILLGIIALYLGIYKYIMSPLYILIVMNALPPILTFALKDYAEKYKLQALTNITEDKPFRLSNLKRKYRYSRVKYVANSISYLLALFLISLWQYKYNNSEDIQGILINVPVLILASGLALRFLTIIFFQIKLPYDVSHNKV
ncbi:MAG: hypothetical protein K0S01_3891 [Herbinix sp.]|jgi:hypothetical protein|nr:hypothetical protein [Herbinix sp.]